MITLYDIPSTLPNKCWSPNVWKTRFALNFKGVEHKTEWVEYPDIEATCKKLGVAPTGHWKSGADYYSVPFIIDDSTGAIVSDSWNIAVYLEETYPAPAYKSLFPTPHSRVVQFAFNKGFGALGLPSELPDLVRYDTAKLLNPVSDDYYIKKHLRAYGFPMEEIAPHGSEKRKELWVKARKKLDALSAEYDRNGPETSFVMGDTLTYADFLLGGFLIWDKLVLPKEDWDVLKSLNGGRWARLLEALEPYSKVVV